MSFKFDQLFYDDFYNATWATIPGGVRQITWSIEENQLELPLNGGSVVANSKINEYKDLTQQAFSLWDSALDSISFVQTNAGNNADVTIATTDLNGNYWGYWNASWNGNKEFQKATIQMNSEILPSAFLTVALHEIGNILGLGDIQATAAIKSVQEEGLSAEMFTGTSLWEDDVLMIKQLYNENDYSNQQDDGIAQLSDGDDKLLDQSDFKVRMMGGNDYLVVTGGSDNFANGNKGEDTILLNGGQGRYLGGSDNDVLYVKSDVDPGTLVNGNRAEDFITGFAGGVTYRGGKDNDLLAVSQGDVWGDKDADTFRALAGDGYAVIQDYTIGEDMVEINMDGSWSNFGDGLMFTDDSGDQLMLLLGVSDVEQVTMV
jgi:hypothetical protein